MSFCVVRDTNIQKSALNFLNNNCNDPSRVSRGTTGKILSNSNYAILTNGSKISVINCKNGGRVGSWDFSTTLQDDQAKIVRVDEVHRVNGKEPFLAVSINCDTRGGIVCIFDFIGSRVIRIILISENISCAHIVDVGQELANNLGPLRIFDGILTVGTEGGNVYIIDLCKQLYYERSNTNADFSLSRIEIVGPSEIENVEHLKKLALGNEAHLAIHLNVVEDNSTGHFVLKEPNWADKVHVNRQEVSISALHYCPQLRSILIGFNFGAFQLWNLMELRLIYTSPICEDHVPITKFAIQEPSDDPRAFCYVWALYSSSCNSSFLPNLVMYALCYESKEFHEGYGMLYEEFQHCAVRFQMELGFNNQSFAMPKGGKCLRLETLVHKNFSTNSSQLDGSEEISSLCMFSWKAESDAGHFTYMALFDLNQWYKAQMPNSLNSDDCVSYMLIICVTDMNSSAEEVEGGVLDVKILQKTLQQFIGTQKLEEHYYPSSFSFETYNLTENRCVRIQYQSIQKALLYQLNSAGPLCLIRPTEIYEEILSSGLSPLFSECSSPISLNNQRLLILNVALEQQLMSWLCKCANEWANGSFSSAGCSLDLLISWAFQRGMTLKNNCDKLCVPLFDYSGLKLDGNTTNTLNNCIRQIKNVSFFLSFVKRNSFESDIDKELLNAQSNICQMVEMYFDVLQWLFNVGLLPENNSLDLDNFRFEDRIKAPYPAEELAEYFRKKRAENSLKTRQMFNNSNSTSVSVFFIDNLIEIECGNKLIDDWKNENDVEFGDGFYPPHSLQLLLRTYLNDGIEICNKHVLVIYLFLDLARILEPRKYSSVITHLIKFPAVFKVSPSLIKITQAFWHLDHGDFATAIEELLDPLVAREDLKIWHHKVAIKSLLVQEQFNFALLYMQVRKPPILDDEDVLCALSLFISNNMLDEAFYLEQHFNSFFDAEKLIKHLLKECSNHKCLSQIVYRNLSRKEEKLFLEYLDEMQHPEAVDLKITYFMQRSHYIEAFNTYEKLENDPSRKGLATRLKSKARDEVIHNYKKLIPTISYKFIQSCEKKPTPSVWREVTRPEPMSVFVHKSEEKSEFKSSLILAALAKAKQTFRHSKNLSLVNSTTEELPFLRTPTMSLQCGSRKRSSVQIIVPKVVDDEEAGAGASPKKRARLASAQSRNSFSLSCDTSVLSTPIIPRKGRIATQQVASREIAETPASILKSKSPNQRRVMNRASVVRFNVQKSSSSSEQSTPLSSKFNDLGCQKMKADTFLFSNSFASLQRASLTLSTNSATESDETFYSPNSSLHNIEEIPKDSTAPPGNLNENEESTCTLPEIKIPETLEKSIEKVQDTPTRNLDSPKARKSYKKLSSEQQAPVRFSPRLNKSRNSSEENSSVSHPPASSPVTSKISARKSLSRQVLENNAFSQLCSDVQSESSIKSLSFSNRRKIAAVFEHEEYEETSCNEVESSDVYVEKTSTREYSERHSVTKKRSSIFESSTSDCSERSEIETSNKCPFLSESLLKFINEDEQVAESSQDIPVESGETEEMKDDDLNERNSEEALKKPTEEKIVELIGESLSKNCPNEISQENACNKESFQQKLELEEKKQVEETYNKRLSQNLQEISEALPKNYADDIHQENALESSSEDIYSSEFTSGPCPLSDSILEFANASKEIVTETEEIPATNNQEKLTSILEEHNTNITSNESEKNVEENVAVTQEEIDEIAMVYDDLSNDKMIENDVAVTNVVYEDISNDANLQRDNEMKESNVLNLNNETDNVTVENRGRLSLWRTEINSTQVFQSPTVFERNIFFFNDNELENGELKAESPGRNNNDNDVQEIIELSSSSEKSLNSSSSESKSTTSEKRSSRRSSSDETPSTNSSNSSKTSDDKFQILERKDDGDEDDPKRKSTKSVELQTGKSLLNVEEKLDQNFTDTPSRRLTRRMSKLSENNDDQDQTNQIVPEKSGDSQKTEGSESTGIESIRDRPQTPRKSRLSIDPLPASEVNLPINIPKEKHIVHKPARSYVRKRTRSVDINLNPTNSSLVPGTSRDLKAEPVMIRRKLRSASVDEAAAATAQKTLNTEETSSSVSERSRTRKSAAPKKRDAKLRSASVDEAALKTLEETSSSLSERSRIRKSAAPKKKDAIQKYASSRRLTRRQASLLASTGENANNVDLELADVESVDPIILLDKANFEGVPDPEEQKIYQGSPSPSSSGVSESASRIWRTRTRSVSDRSSAASDVSTPTRTSDRSNRERDSPAYLNLPTKTYATRKRKLVTKIDLPEIKEEVSEDKNDDSNEKKSESSTVSTRVSTRSKKSSLKSSTQVAKRKTKQPQKKATD